MREIQNLFKKLENSNFVLGIFHLKNSKRIIKSHFIFISFFWGVILASERAYPECDGKVFILVGNVLFFGLRKVMNRVPFC